jgi:2'-5' RNA ligase
MNKYVIYIKPSEELEERLKQVQEIIKPQTTKLTTNFHATLLVVRSQSPDYLCEQLEKIQHSPFCVEPSTYDAFGKNDLVIRLNSEGMKNLHYNVLAAVSAGRIKENITANKGEGQTDFVKDVMAELTKELESFTPSAITYIKEKFLNPRIINEGEEKWLQGINSQYIGENYNPHITIADGNPKAIENIPFIRLCAFHANEFVISEKNGGWKEIAKYELKIKKN